MPLSRRVLVLDGTERTDAQRATAAILDAGAGAALAGRSALAWWGLRGFDLSLVDVVRVRGTTSTPCTLAQVHRMRNLTEADITISGGIRTLRPLRAIWTEAARYAGAREDIGIVRIGRLVDTAHRSGLLSWAELRAAVERLQQMGRSGTRIMRAVSEDRPPGSSATESRNEDRLVELLAGSGAPPLDRQPVVGGCGPIGRTDFRDPWLPLVVEVNSMTFHTTPSDRRADIERYQALVDAGFTVAVVWDIDLWSRPDDALSTVAQGRRRAAHGLPGVLHSSGCPWPATDRGH